MRATFPPNTLAKVLDFLSGLEQANVWYTMAHVRGSLMVIAAIPGQRWEIEFFPDDHIEIERFYSSGKIEDDDLFELLRRELKDSAESDVLNLLNRESTQS